MAASKEDVLANWQHDAYLRTLGVLLLVAAFAVLGRRMVRQIKIQTRSEFEAVNAREKSDQLNATLVQLAMHDGLTGLANRRYFDRTAATEIARLGREKGALALVMVDVDHFKLYNDIYGHAKGDECLKTVAQAIASSRKRARDLAARYGGEEFALILPDCDMRGATALAQQLRQSVADLHLPHSGGKNGQVSVSVGVAALHPVMEGDTMLTLIERADQALYQAKQNGRDRIALFPDQIRNPGQERLQTPETPHGRHRS